MQLGRCFMAKKYIFAYDRKIGKRVTHEILEGNIARSLVSGQEFKYIPGKGKKKSTKSKKKRR